MRVEVWQWECLETPATAKNFTGFLEGIYSIKIDRSALDIAIASQDIRYFENRLKKGESINDIKNSFNQSVAAAAALYNKVNLLKFFKQQGARLDKALVYAASNGSYEAVKYLLSLGINPDERDEDQNNDTALMQAAFGGYLDVAKELIKHGSDINAKDINQQSVLTKALWSSNDELVKFLQNHGAK